MKRRECKCRGRRWLASVLAVALLLAEAVVGIQAQEPVNIMINKVDSSDFPRLTAYATVADATGHAITELNEGAFTLAEDGTPVDDFTIEYLENVGEPILMTLVLDTSGSMEGPALQDTQAAAVRLINDLGPADEVAVISFNAVVTTHVEFTTDKGTAVAAVEALAAGGGTAFNDAVYEAVAMLAHRPRGRKALVVLTDGDDTDSVLTIDDAIDAAKDASIPVYAIGFGPSIRPNVLERLARLAGGHFYRSPSSEEVGESFEAVARLLRYQYVLHLVSSLPADGAQHSLHVSTEAEGVQADTVVGFVAERRQVTVAIVEPSSGERIAGLVNLVPRIEAPAEVAQVEYLLDGAGLATVTTGDFSYDWGTAGVPLGEHTITARATDSAGNEGQMDVIVEVVEPITVGFVAPVEEDLEKLGGEVAVEVAVEALDGVARVEFAVDGAVVTTVESSPYRFIWDTRAVDTGQHTLAAVAYDVNNLSDQDSLDVWVEFRGPTYGLWVALGVLLLAGGVILPLAVRKRRKMLVQPAPVVGPGATPGSAAAVKPVRDGRAPVAWLVVEQGPQIGHRWPVALGETSLGRSRADNDIVIPSQTASRQHAVIRADAETCVYYDLKTTNPTLVNDTPIVGSYELTEGDRIRVGDVILQFTLK